MEPDYPPIPEIFVSTVTYTPGGLHTHEDCTPFGPWFLDIFIVVPVLELVVLGV